MDATPPSDLVARCGRCRHRHRPDLRCWKPPYSTSIVATLLVDAPPCWLRYPGCLGAATEADHVVPRSRGGDDDPANLRPACARCNRARAHGDPFPVDPPRAPAGVPVSDRWRA